MNQTLEFLRCRKCGGPTAIFKGDGTYQAECRKCAFPNSISKSMTRKQVNLVYFRARGVFEQQDLERIFALTDAVAEEDIMSRPIEPKIKMAFEDRRDFIDAVVACETYLHGVKVLGKAHLEDALKQEKANALALCTKYGF